MNRRGFLKSLVSAASIAAVGAKIVFVERRLPSFSEVVAKTLRERRSEIAANVIAHNALFKRMERAGLIKPWSGGLLVKEFNG